MKHGKYDKAFRSFLKLRAHPIISARDYYYSHVIYEEERLLSPNSNYFSRMRDCFTIPRIRRANYGASTVMIAQQMCGINSELQAEEEKEEGRRGGGKPRLTLVISFYSSSIFTRVNYTDTQALYASLGYGAVQVVFTIPTLFLIDTVGRRKLCLIVSGFCQSARAVLISDIPLDVHLPARRGSVDVEHHWVTSWPSRSCRLVSCMSSIAAEP